MLKNEMLIIVFIFFTFLLLIIIGQAQPAQNIKVEFIKNYTNNYGSLTIKNNSQNLIIHSFEKGTSSCIYFCYFEGYSILFRNSVIFNDILIYNISNQTVHRNITFFVSENNKWVLSNTTNIYNPGIYKWRIEGLKLTPEETLDVIPLSYEIELTSFAYWKGMQPMVYWKFDEGAGINISNDTIGIRNISINYTKAHFSPGILGNAIALNSSTAGQVGGKSGNISQNHPALIFNNSNFTISFWYNASHVSNGKLFSTDYFSGAGGGGGAGGGWSVVTENDESLSFYNDTNQIGKENITLAMNLSNRTWHYIVFTREGTNGRGYVDGANIGNYSLSALIGINATNFSLYNDGGGANPSLTTYLDDLAIYNISFSPQDVIIAYNKGIGRIHDASILPTIITNNTVPAFPTMGDLNTFVNVTLNDSDNDTIYAIYFSVEAPNSTLIINSQNGTIRGGSNNANGFEWFSPFFNITGVGALRNWNWSYIASSNQSPGPNIFVNTSSSGNFSVNDSTAPSVNITNPTGIINTRNNINLNFSLIDTGDISSCVYNITRGASRLIEISNTVITNCENTTFNVSVDTTFDVRFYANDTSNNINATTTNNFTVSTEAGGGGGAGGGSGRIEKIQEISVIGLQPINGTKIYTILQREIIYASINTFCSEKIRGEVLSIADFSESCSLIINDLNIIIERLRKFNVIVPSQDMILFYKNYKDELFFQGSETIEIIDTYGLFTSVLGLTILLQLDPPSFNRPIVIYSRNGSYEVSLKSISNKPLSSCEVISNTPNIRCTSTNSTLVIFYNITDTNFFNRVFSGVISVATQAEENKVEQKKLPVNIHIYNLGYNLGGIPFYLVILLGFSTIILIFLFILNKYSTIKRIKRILKNE